MLLRTLAVLSVAQSVGGWQMGGIHACAPLRAAAPFCLMGPDSGEDKWNDAEEKHLRFRMASSQTGARLGTSQELLRGVERAFVLIFNHGQPDEGVYTLQGRQTPTSYVLTFEHADEAARFAELLQAEGFDLAKPVPWYRERVSEFCESTGFELGFVPVGTLITPPEHNSYDVEAYEELAQKDGLDAIGTDRKSAFADSHPATDMQKEISMLEHIFKDLDIDADDR